MHTDAVQAAAARSPSTGKTLPVDLLTFSAHKVNGLKGAGRMLARKGLEIEAVLHGGHQERGRRGGTENVVGIVAMGKAFLLLSKNMAAKWPKPAGFGTRSSGRCSNGSPTSCSTATPPCGSRTRSISLSGFVEGEALLLNLDMMGIACSSGSACTSGSLEGSPILMAMGADPTEAQGALRFSLGIGNTDDDVAYAVDAIETVVDKLRAMSPLYHPREAKCSISKIR